MRKTLLQTVADQLRTTAERIETAARALAVPIEDATLSEACETVLAVMGEDLHLSVSISADRFGFSSERGWELDYRIYDGNESHHGKSLAGALNAFLIAQQKQPENALQVAEAIVRVEADRNAEAIAAGEPNPF